MAHPPPDSPAAPIRSNRPLLGIAYMVAGVATISVMDASAKFLIGYMTSFQVMGIRSAIVFAMLMGFLTATGRLDQLRTRRPVAHLVRGLAAAGSMLFFFECMRTLPLATAIAICFIAPLLMTAFSVVLLRERVGLDRWMALVVGFAGVGIIFGPEAVDGIFQPGALLALAAAALYALSMTMVRWLSPTETDMTMIVMQCAVLMAVGIAGMALSPEVPTSAGALPAAAWAGLGAASVFVVLNQLLSYRAFRLAPVGAIAPLGYTELVWATFFGWAFWDEWPAPNVWYGAAVVVAAGLYVIWRERVRAVAG